MRLSVFLKRYSRVVLCLVLVCFAAYFLRERASRNDRINPYGPFKAHKEKLWLFDNLGVRYMHLLSFSDKCQSLASVRPQDYSKYQDTKPELDALTDRYGPEIAQSLPSISNVSIYYVSDEVGYGILANKNFKQGDFIGEYTGVVVERSVDSTYSWSYPPSGGAVLGKNFSLDGGEQGNELRFINHSDDPNVKMLFVFNANVWHVIYVASKDIKKGTQLLTHYGENYWSQRNKVDL